MRRLLTMSNRVIAGGALLFVTAIAMASAIMASEDAVPSTVQNAPATHKQETVVSAIEGTTGAKLEDFCINGKGQIVALLGQADGVSSPWSILDPLKSSTPPKFECEVRIFAADGKLVQKWPVGFSGQAINTAPNDAIVVGGDGHVARFNAEGKKLHEAESPQMTYIAENPEEMRERAKEQRESDIAMYKDQLKQFEDQLKEAEKTKDDLKAGETPRNAPSAADQFQSPEFLKSYIKAYQQQLEIVQKKSIDDVLNEVLARAKRTHSICANDTDVFVTCPAMAGYGYGVWRTNDKFGEAKEIVKSLSGCCGQMDVQCCEDGVYVCENSRHRVVKYDRDGKELAHFGKRDRSGEGENFGGCCNPMNLCFTKQGDLYVSESNGVVKRFTTAGEYLGIAGVAKVEPGCKNSCVGVTADDSRMFYIDIQKSQIIVLARAEESSK